ncbi:MAG TPA: hypothetical protein K8V15_07290 [Tessaracoccus flavescens]|uniref:Uncharacterized protein n=1 Tax=Tessaracoccus flavescens TaxID=399497 RepID=A0A921EQN7_9ACTN|nr:hypothetical protein [Tessaracoccus flavescens]
MPQVVFVSSLQKVLPGVDPIGDLDYATGWVTGAEWLRRRRALGEAVS